MAKQETIVDAGNTLVPVLLALKALGFTVRREVEGDGEAWSAESSELALLADHPTVLLGLATMRSMRGSNWKASPGEFDQAMRAVGLDA